jgi:hypothetical protein
MNKEEVLREQMDEKDVDVILSRFIETNQQLYTELEALGLTFEAVEVIMVPIERRIFAKARELKGNGLKEHRIERPLYMKDTGFDEHIRKTLPPGAMLRYVDMNNLDAETIERILENEEKANETVDTELNDLARTEG